MGSKTPEGYKQEPNGGNRISKEPKSNIQGAGEPGRFPNDDLGGSDEEGDGDEDDLSKSPTGMIASSPDKDLKKSRKRSKKKKKKSAGSTTKQSCPPRVVLSSLFPSGEYPEGEVHPYSENLARTTGEEHRANDRMDSTFLSDYRQAAEAHRQVRKWAQSVIKPGKGLTEIAEGIEDGVRALIDHQGVKTGDSLRAGMGFPTGLCLNNTAAHYTPTPGMKDVELKSDDVLKVDFGVHVNGRIVDSAFTVAFDPMYDNLLASVKDATNTGIQNAGIDARMSEIGASIQEVMESYEVEIKGKTYPIKAIRTITGHDIKQYRIHGDKQVPFTKNSSKQKMEEGEVFAIETFGSTGKGYLTDDIGIYGYGRNPDVSATHLHHSTAKALLKTIDENFGTIVFCRRYLERLGVKNYLPAMRTLLASGVVESYAPLSDIKGSYTAQFEHTILLRSSGKEVISRGDDY